MRLAHNWQSSRAIGLRVRQEAFCIRGPHTPAAGREKRTGSLGCVSAGHFDAKLPRLQLVAH